MRCLLRTRSNLNRGDGHTAVPKHRGIVQSVSAQGSATAAQQDCYYNRGFESYPDRSGKSTGRTISLHLGRRFCDSWNGRPRYERGVRLLSHPGDVHRKVVSSSLTGAVHFLTLPREKRRLIPCHPLFASWKDGTRDPLSEIKYRGKQM
jgi:hypothetical protein